MQGDRLVMMLRLWPFGETNIVSGETKLLKSSKSSNNGRPRDGQTLGNHTRDGQTLGGQIPWHFWLFVISATMYVGWRMFQLFERIVL